MQKERGAFADAEATLRQALRIAPDNAVLRYNWALLVLLLGRTQEAWDGWEQRFRAGAIPARPFGEPQWRGTALGNRTLLVHTEQGLGDVIQFARYLPALRDPAIGGHVVFEAPPRLIRLLSSNPALPPMIPAEAKLPPFDSVIPLLSLPARTALPAAQPPYLFAEPDRDSRVGGAYRIGRISRRHRLAGQFRPLRGQRPVVSAGAVRAAGRCAGRSPDQPAKGRGRGADRRRRIPAANDWRGWTPVRTRFSTPPR